MLETQNIPDALDPFLWIECCVGDPKRPNAAEFNIEDPAVTGVPAPLERWGSFIAQTVVDLDPVRGLSAFVKPVSVLKGELCVFKAQVLPWMKPPSSVSESEAGARTKEFLRNGGEWALCERTGRDKTGDRRIVGEKFPAGVDWNETI